MPTSRNRDRTSRRSSTAAGTVVVLVALLIGYLAVHSSPTAAPERPTACVAGSAGQGVELSVGQAGIAATIAGVASKQRMPTRAVAVAYAAAWQESKFADLDYGDLDSVGVFQQRPSQGWGTAQEIEDPVYAAGRFFAALAAVPGYRHLPIAVAAQAVQRSADGSAYAQYAEIGSLMARAFSGSLPHAVWCSYGSGVGTARLLAARRALARSFGRLAGRVAADPAVSVDVTTSRQGWAVAAWLVCHAASYGIADVRYLGYEWLAASGSGRWRAEPDPAGPTAREAASHETSADGPGASNAVVYG